MQGHVAAEAVTETSQLLMIKRTEPRFVTGLRNDLAMKRHSTSQLSPRWHHNVNTQVDTLSAEAKKKEENGGILFYLTPKPLMLQPGSQLL